MHKLGWLRTLRIFLSVVLLPLTALVFLDTDQWIPVRLINTVTWPQFIPSFLHFFNSGGLFASGFLFILLMTIVFGRVYCSGICPLGTIQDIIFRFRSGFFGQKPLRYEKARNIFRFSILTLVIVSFLSGTAILLNMLDPYSNFGRMMSNIFRPVFLFSGNELAGILEDQNIYWLSKTEFKGFQAASIAFSSGFLLLVGWLSVFHGRLYCNTLCPVGALLGLTSKFSLFKLRLNQQDCNSCGQCSKVCKAQCIDIKTKTIDFSRCVSCYNCLSACPSDGVLFSCSLKAEDSVLETARTGKANKRRALIKAFVFSSSILAVKAYATRITGGEKPTEIPEERTLVSSPPGSGSHDHFNGNCTACHLCISICPTQVLQPSLLHYGLHGILQPYMDYHAGFCNFECDLCGKVCPTNAIKSLVPEQKKRVQIGKAVFIKENCIVYTDNTDCGACSEHCPTKAVNMVQYKERLTIPEINNNICIGCGACEYACPTKPYRAIFIEGNDIHRLADKPVQEEIKRKATTEDFPF
ncbi:MAG: 4Fe-4S binding protein [Bacteroidota bacterium]